MIPASIRQSLGLLLSAMGSFLILESLSTSGMVPGLSGASSDAWESALRAAEDPGKGFFLSFILTIVVVTVSSRGGSKKCKIWYLCMCHGNTPIQPHEKCIGFTQYAAGALFRWVDNGFQRVEDVQGAEQELKQKLDAEAPTHFKHLLSLFSKSEELADDRI